MAITSSSYCSHRVWSRQDQSGASRDEGCCFLDRFLLFHGVIPGANLPVEVFAPAARLLILLPAALWITSITDGRAGVAALAMSRRIR